ncbi:MAG: N-acetylmuramoyl-L-alanine amidase [Alphaproteobacteria bacterium]|nr:MAG: N-acetylmuramoyl-L-alanine amidase [Alphaproteobacteria bacterium]
MRLSFRMTGRRLMERIPVIRGRDGDTISSAGGRWPVPFVMAVLMLLAVTAAQAADRTPAHVDGLRLGENPGFTRFVIDVDRKLAPRVFFLANPYRMVIDLPPLRFAKTMRKATPRGLVKALRYGAFKPGVSRVVLELAGPARLLRQFTLPPRGTGRYRLVFDLAPTDAGHFARLVAARAPAKADPPPGRSPPVRQMKGMPVPARPVVYLDAGHGGMDPGTMGALGVPEKVITLAVARRAARVINQSGRYRARLTRDRDVFLPLRERIRIARRGGADLFISLHADSIRNRRVRGATVYTLSETASDKEAAALARRENKADVLAGLDLDDQPPEVAGILISLAQREAMNRSAHFANLLVPELRRRVRVRSNPHRYAGFVVLKAPDVPSVLVEMGYLSNRQDAAFLASRRGQQRIAEALLAAIDRYFAALRAGRLR